MEILTLPFRPRTSRFWRISPVSRFRIIFSWFFKLFLAKGRECFLCLTSLFSTILCRFYLFFCGFSAIFLFGILALDCGSFGCRNALDRPFSKMAAENLNKSKLKTNTSSRKSTLTLVTLPSFSISGEISAEKM